MKTAKEVLDKWKTSNHLRNIIDLVDAAQAMEEYAAQFQQPTNPALIPFDLKRALAGDKVVTRDGQNVTELHLFKTMNGQPLIAIINGARNFYNTDGSWDIKPSVLDLFMAPRTVTKFANIYKNVTRLNLFDTYDEAYNGRSEDGDYITTTKITWEE